MTRTLRRQPFTAEWETDPNRWRKVKHEKTCRPGCTICGKDPAFKRPEQKRVRRAGKVEAAGDLPARRVKPLYVL